MSARLAFHSVGKQPGKAWPSDTSDTQGDITSTAKPKPDATVTTRRDAMYAAFCIGDYILQAIARDLPTCPVKDLFDENKNLTADAEGFVIEIVRALLDESEQLWLLSVEVPGSWLRQHVFNFYRDKLGLRRI